MGLSLTTRKFNSIWVIVDQFTKSVHFIPINTNYNAQKYVEIYITRVLCLHRVLKMIISDRGSQFIAHFWEQLHDSLGTHLIHSSAYHPQTNGQIERVNQILEYMLRACVMEYQGSWDKNLSWAEFSYNNSYQESLKMAPFDFYTNVVAAHHSIVLSQERRLSLVQTSLMRSKRRSAAFKTT
jgi:transposase InsO family protein